MGQLNHPRGERVGMSRGPATQTTLATPATMATPFPGVYAVGDVATIGVPKAGVFSEGAARVVAASLIAALRGGEQPGPYDGLGSCYIEFGGGRVGRVDVDFLSGPKPTGTFHEPSGALVAEKHRFGSSRRARWFDR
jgi:sulfide:quinone oxidoreductase